MPAVEQRIQRKLFINGFVILGIMVLAEFFATTIRLASVILPSWGLLFFVIFYITEQNHRPRPIADLVTAGRLVGGIVFYTLAGLGILGQAAALLIVLILEAADGLDGRLARKYGPTKFGGIFDMESDAFVIMLLSFAAVSFTQAPSWMLIPGLLRYLFFFPFLILKPIDSQFPRLLSWFSKTVCVATVFCLGSVWYLPSASKTAVGIVTILLVISFLWESLFYAVVRLQTRSR